jgi:colanic acid/amylovoran biosynthesis protein
MNDYSFLLVGNSSNDNRGCEAINRGTLAVLRAATRIDLKAGTGVLADPDVIARQRANCDEGDPETFGIAVDRTRRLAGRLRRRLFGGRQPIRVTGLDPWLGNARMVLEVGGDNYSLDYGRPDVHLEIDRQILDQGLPLAIWGASIGPFDADPAFETEILAHFARLSRIFVRETISHDYLVERGLRNVSLMADPAFLLKPAAPPEILWDEAAAKGAIGLNFSPFQAKMFGGEAINYWQFGPAQFDPLVALCAQMVAALVRRYDRPILLVPHVITDFAWNNDWALLQRVMGALAPSIRDRVQCLPSNLRSAELKWAIAACSMFAGSRTHSTIAAMSSGIPTLTFGYSRKSVGLARDLYDHDDFCIPLNRFSVAAVMAAFDRMMEQEGDLKLLVARQSGISVERALAAGRELLALA